MLKNVSLISLLRSADSLVFRYHENLETNTEICFFLSSVNFGGKEKRKSVLVQCLQFADITGKNTAGIEKGVKQNWLMRNPGVLAKFGAHKKKWGGCSIKMLAL